MAEADTVQSYNGGMPMDEVDEYLRKMGVDPARLARLPAVSLLGGPQAQQMASQGPQLTANLPAQPATPVVNLMGSPSGSSQQAPLPAPAGWVPGPGVDPNDPNNPYRPIDINLIRHLPAKMQPAATAQPAAATSQPATPVVSLMGGAPRADLPAPIEQLKKDSQNLFRTPVVSLTGQPNVQQPSRYDGVVPQSAADRGWLESAKRYERSQREQEAERGVDTAANAMAMFAASRANGGAGATGVPTVQPRLTAPEAAPDLGQPATAYGTPPVSLTDKQPLRPTYNPDAAKATGAPLVTFTDTYRDEAERGAQAVAAAQRQADAVKPGWMRKLGSLGIAALAGAGGGAEFGAKAGRNFMGRPKTEAEQRVADAQAQTTANEAAIAKEAGLAETQSQIDEHNAQAAEANRKANAPAAPPKTEDPKIGEYTNADGHPTFVFRKPTGEIYETPASGTVQKKDGGETETTPFKLWRQQHPTDDVKEYFKLQPEARNETRRPKDQPQLTPGQKSTLARRYKGALSDIEEEFRARQSGTYVDKRSGELLPPMTQEELNRRKQDAEDSYKDELEAAGESVTRFRYGSENANAGAAQNAANSGTQHQVGDEVTYKGQRYRIAGIKNGKAQLAPLGSNQ